MFPANCLRRRQFARNIKAYFLGNVKKNINLSSAAIAKGMVKVKKQHL